MSQESVISLSFHPSGDIIAAGCGRKVCMWAYKAAHQQQQQPRKELHHTFNVRCVCFPPGHHSTLLVGVANAKMFQPDPALSDSPESIAAQRAQWDFTFRLQVDNTHLQTYVLMHIQR